MNILGLNYYFHDSTACVVMDGKLVVAIEEERLTRNKHTTEFPLKSIDRCLYIAGLTPRDIDAVAVSIKPTKDWATKVKFAATHRKSARHLACPRAGRRPLSPESVQGLVSRHVALRRPADPLRAAPHCARGRDVPRVSVDNAAIISIDGSGEWATSFLGEGRGTSAGGPVSTIFPTLQASGDVDTMAICDLDPARSATGRRPVRHRRPLQRCGRNGQGRTARRRDRFHPACRPHRPAIAALQAGAHVMVEKPMATTAADGRAIAAAALRQGGR